MSDHHEVIGTNNCTSDSETDIFAKMLDLRQFIRGQLPHCEVYFSTLIRRNDNNKAAETVNKVNILLEKFEADFMDNNNIDRHCIGGKGLHLNDRGIGKLVLNIVNWLKSF